MPNVTINPTRDGRISVTGEPLFLGAQGLASGSFLSVNPSNSSPAFGISFVAARGGGTNTAIYRYFMYFDTSAYTTTITNPEIEVYRYGSFSNDEPVIVKAQNSTNGLQAFDGTGVRDIEKQDYSRYSSNASERYYAGTHTFTSGWNTLALNDSASVAISESNAFCICVLDGPADYAVRQPGTLPTTTLTGFYGGTTGTYPIRLHFTSSVSGWAAGKFLGVEATSIDKIIGVDRTDIDKVIGV